MKRISVEIDAIQKSIYEFVTMSNVRRFLCRIPKRLGEPEYPAKQARK